ncbi:unnamed protein product [Strongylus vulgaris]|uniref:Large ribosomal subunit protein bL19m n=1 Tax=Strongylus vulgaris TaxID=40348 RepID=A0A3P7K6N2_STRVU|nr:unnamed protein product [Strongylus vulgaris]
MSKLARLNPYKRSIVAVTTSERYMGSKEHRFVGICIRREKQGLHHQFTLRNVLDGVGVEIMYDLYNPTIRKIETLKLEKRLDKDLSYLVDALPEYSTFDFHMESIAHPAGTPVPVNPIKRCLVFSPMLKVLLMVISLLLLHGACSMGRHGAIYYVN